jgi:hypothetical protein
MSFKIGKWYKLKEKEDFVIADEDLDYYLYLGLKPRMILVTGFKHCNNKKKCDIKCRGLLKTVGSNTLVCGYTKPKPWYVTPAYKEVTKECVTK